MARITTESGAKNTDQLTFQANGTDRIELPSSDFIADANMARDGDNLLLETLSGEVAVIEGYFSADPAPLLASPDGAVLTPNLVQAFAHSPMEFAANDTASDESPIGAVEEVKGNVTVTRVDGMVESVAIGTPIYQGDVVKTDAAGAVNIVFMDETSMAISENARMAIDEYSYDPATQSGTTNFSVLRGLFVFTSGLIGRDDPDDVKIDTPVGSIGIRGTIIAGNINPNGESNITVLEGAIVITNGDGNITLSNAFETVTLQGFNAPMSTPVVLPAAEINARFASVSSVNPSLFSTISEAVQEQQLQQPAPAPAPAPEAPQSQMQPQDAPASSPIVNQAPVAQSAPAMDAPVVQDQVLAPAPVEALPPANMADPSASGFGTTTTGLPSANIVAGQTSAGTFDSSVNTLPGAGFAPPPPPPPVVMAPLPPMNTGVMPPPVNAAPPPGTIQQPPPSVITPPTPPAGPALFVTSNPINDLAVTNAIVGHAMITGFAVGVTASYTFSGGGTLSTYYELIADGVGGVNVRLRTSGENALRQSLEVFDLGDVDIVATPTDGSPVITRTLNVVINDANAGRVIDMDGINNNGVTTIADGINNEIGYSVSALGDINNDGFDDFVFSNDTSAPGQNHSYVVFGSATGIPSGSVPGLIDTTISIRPNPTPGTNASLSTVAGIGDFNGDGVEDYIVGQSNNIIGGIASGTAAIISGANGVNARQFSAGAGAGAELGSDVDGVGDLNNDGYADVVVGAAGFDAGNGRAYVINGSNASWGTPLPQTTFISGTGFEFFGTSVTGLGDFNGDGYSDFAVGAPSFGADLGRVRIYEGTKTGTSTLLGGINGAPGQFLGLEVDGVGDVNGDGLSDMMVGGNNTAAIYFGGDTTTPDITFNPLPGYTLSGGGAAGDFNGDGFKDFTISLADANDTKTYVVLGKVGGFNVDINYLKNPGNAFELQYDKANSGDILKVSSVGDVNGDGYDDLAIGVPDANGGEAQGNGGVVIVNGRGSGNIDSDQNADAFGDHLVGTRNNDILNNLNFVGVSMRAGAGNDELHIGNMDFLSIDGGNGMDSMIMHGPSVNFSSLNFEKISGIENIVFGNNGQTMTLTMENIFNLLKTSDDGTLKIDLASGVTTGSLILDDQNGVTNPADNVMGIVDALNQRGNGALYVTASAATDYDAFKIGGYTLYINDDITATTTVT